MPKGDVFSLSEVTSPMEDPKKCYEETLRFLDEHIGKDEEVEVAVSGGTDSHVVAYLLREAIGKRVRPVHIDHGFMRSIRGGPESEVVCGMFQDFPDFVYVNDVAERFYQALEGLEDGDRKRAAFREVYTSVLTEQMERLGCSVTADGTILPDIKETRQGVKLQHNVDLNFGAKKLEPLAALSKQEVRALARYMGVPTSVYLRQPFPGPGLQVRTVGKFSRQKLEVERAADDIVRTAYEDFMLGQYGREMLIDGETGMQVPFQYFAATFDGASELPSPETIRKLQDALKSTGCKYGSSRVLSSKATGISYDEAGKGHRVYSPPLLVLLDEINVPELMKAANRFCSENGFSRMIYTVSEGQSREMGYVVAIRSIDSVDVKHVNPTSVGMGSLPKAIGKKIANQIPKVACVAYDITSKPPATVEYE